MTKKKRIESKNPPIKIYAADLPLSCPREGVALWNLHPQVYLPIEETHEEMCPYCGTHYILAEKE